MASILVVTYDTSSGKYLAQLAGSAQISDGAITSGKIASGIVGTVHLRDLNVTSAKLAAAVIASIEAGVADESITSAKLASGAVVGDRVAIDGIVSSHIGANVIGGIHILAGAIVSGKLGTNIIATPHILNQGILSASIGANEIGGAHILDGSILSGEIGANAVGGAKLWDYGLVSGKYASGSITEGALVSGISIDITEISQEPSYRAEALISSFLGVQFSISGYFNYAQAADIDTMPAVGVAIANILSGQIGTFQHQGRMINPNWDFSGHVGELLFLGTSSQVTLTAPTASGECAQRVAKVIDPTTVFVRPELAFIQVAE